MAEASENLEIPGNRVNKLINSNEFRVTLLDAGIRARGRERSIDVSNRPKSIRHSAWL